MYEGYADSISDTIEMDGADWTSIPTEQEWTPRIEPQENMGQWAVTVI